MPLGFLLHTDNAVLSARRKRPADFAGTSRSAATKRAYCSDWADIEAWCRAAGLARAAAALTTVGAYLTDRAGHLKVATLARRIAAGRNVLDRVTPIFSILPP